MGRLRVICIIALACLTGCQSHKIVTAKTVSGMPPPLLSPWGTRGQAEAIQYLQSRSPKVLESVLVWDNPYGPGLKLITAHYEVRTTLLKPSMLERIGAFVESAYRAYNLQLPEPIETKSRFVMYLFADRRQWEQFTRNFTGEQAEIFCRIKAGAYYYDGVCVAYDIGDERTLSVIGHEGWHQFNDKHFKFRLPSWLDEGVAMLFEAYQDRDGTFRFDPAQNEYRLESLKKTLERDRMIPLEELIATTPGDVLATDRADAAMAFYSQSYGLVRFLQETGSGSPRVPQGDKSGGYRRLLADGLHGDWPLDEVSKQIAADRSVPRNILWNQIVGLILFQEYIGGDFEPVEQEYLSFCRRIVAGSQDERK